MSKFIALKKFIKDQDGAALAEYAVALAVILAGTIGALQLLGTNITNVINQVAGVISGA
jgi:Flp pilus assembly pilin Flp